MNLRRKTRRGFVEIEPLLYIAAWELLLAFISPWIGSGAERLAPLPREICVTVFMLALALPILVPLGICSWRALSNHRS